MYLHPKKTRCNILEEILAGKEYPGLPWIMIEGHSSRGILKVVIDMCSRVDVLVTVRNFSRAIGDDWEAE
jgi:hypothetical protein